MGFRQNNEMNRPVSQWVKLLRTLRWLPGYLRHAAARRSKRFRPTDLIFALADHFEPSINPDAPGCFVDRQEQERRLARWCREYPKVADAWRDSDGYPFRHTYFYPAEQFDKDLVERLVDHCHSGWGEIEIHLHHGIESPDTPENTRRLLVEFRDALTALGCLSQLDGMGPARYAFVHGNWTLANSGGGLFCGVDSEMQILAETGCFADFTLPSAPSRAQVAKTNSLYECTLPLDQQSPHRRGLDLEVGRAPGIFPLIIQGPLMLDYAKITRGHLLPQIENANVSASRLPSRRRLRLWQNASITVKGRPEWVFIKLHCHGMDPREDEAMLGPVMTRFVNELMEDAENGGGPRIHFVTAREMVNIVFAACEGREGNPGDFRDFRFRLMTRRFPGANAEVTSNSAAFEGR